MTWTPSEGLERAEAIVGGLEIDAGNCGVLSPFPPVYRHRMVEVIARAIDQALEDGAERRPFEHQAYGVKPDGVIGIISATQYNAAVGDNADAEPELRVGPGEAHKVVPEAYSLRDLKQAASIVDWEATFPESGTVGGILTPEDHAPKTRKRRKAKRRAKKAKAVADNASAPEVGASAAHPLAQ